MEPPSSDTASGTHESSRGRSRATPPTRVDLGPVGTLLQPGDHVLAILGLNSSADSSDFVLIVGLALTNPPAPALVAAGET